jgi:hypothetical protein
VFTGQGRQRREVVQEGSVRYRGARYRHHYFFVEWDDGPAEQVGLAALKRLLVVH